MKEEALMTTIFEELLRYWNEHEDDKSYLDNQKVFIK